MKTKPQSQSGPPRRAAGPTAPRGVSRRGFLRQLGATALVFPAIVPARVLGRGGHRPPSERLAGAVIGIGGPGSGAVRAFASGRDTQLVAVCDVADAKLAQATALAAESGGIKDVATYKDFRELLARGDLDVVYIATPDHWHAIMSIAAMKAGLDVYCEKPLTLTIREGRVMVETARQYGRVLQTGSMQRSTATFYDACTLVRAGRLGPITHVTASVGNSSGPCLLPEEPVPAGFDWDLWLGPAPWAPYHRGRVSGNFGTDQYHWRLWRDYSGGSMTDFGAHHFDIVQWGLGMDESGPVRIVPPDNKQQRELEYIYANGIRLIRRYDSFGDVVFYGAAGKIGCGRSTIRSDPPELVTNGYAPHEETLYRSGNHLADFLQCVRTRQRPICDVEVGHRSATVCHLGNIAMWLGRPLEWDPVREQFVNDPEANRWLDRPRRAPWIL